MGSEMTGSTMQVHYFRVEEPLKDVHSLESALRVAGTRALTESELSKALAYYRALEAELERLQPRNE
ncbi:hypothetical protein JGU66_18810 [Myxococcaceae bacterium JPH2]|nr:hypothetical protein [Myxococcaceae bacterium JPH2]